MTLSSKMAAKPCPLAPTNWETLRPSLVHVREHVPAHVSVDMKNECMSRNSSSYYQNINQSDFFSQRIFDLANKFDYMLSIFKKKIGKKSYFT